MDWLLAAVAWSLDFFIFFMGEEPDWMLAYSMDLLIEFCLAE